MKLMAEALQAGKTPQKNWKLQCETILNSPLLGQVQTTIGPPFGGSVGGFNGFTGKNNWAYCAIFSR